MIDGTEDKWYLIQISTTHQTNWRLLVAACRWSHQSKIGLECAMFVNSIEYEFVFGFYECCIPSNCSMQT